MACRLFESRYKDQPATSIESETIRAQFLPGSGAKLASLVYKPRNFELMVQAAGAEYRLQPFGWEYTAGECTGFDDMFPTIDACYYDRYPWQGVKMADHGEVWSLPWRLQVGADQLDFVVFGVRFPYRLEKRVSFPADSSLRLDYRLTNLSPFDLDCLWAAHRMVNLEEDVELVLPEGVESVVGTFDVTGRFGAYGDTYAWPVATLHDGSRRDLRRLRPRSTGDAYKYYVKGALPAGGCGLRYPRSDFTLALTFPVARVPYLGVLPNEGGWRDHYNVFLEPCTAPFDRPDAARYRGQLTPLQGLSTVEWHLSLHLGEGLGFTHTAEDDRELG
jgi:hypothetical protein